MEAKSFAAGQSLERGTVVGLAGNGRISGDAVVVGFRTLERGKRSGQVEYRLAPMLDGQWGQRVYGCQAVGTRAFGAPSRSYTVQQAEARMQAGLDAAEQVAGVRHDRQTACRDALGDVTFDQHGRAKAANIEVGGKVLVTWRNGTTVEKVLAININTGKVAIAQPFNRTGKRWIPSTIVQAVPA